MREFPDAHTDYAHVRRSTQKYIHEINAEKETIGIHCKIKGKPFLYCEIQLHKEIERYNIYVCITGLYV